MTAQTTELSTFDQLSADVTIKVQPMLVIKVIDTDSERDARAAGGQLAALKKEIEKRKKEALAPLELKANAIKAAAQKALSILELPDTYIRKQLNDYAAEVQRIKNAELAAQREKEELERKIAAEARQRESDALRAKQDAERKARETAHAAEQQRLAAEAEARKKKAEAELASQEFTASLFNRGGKSKAQEESEAAVRESEERARAEASALAEKAEADARALAEQQERERLAEEARRVREADEADRAAEAERKRIESMGVSGGRREPEITVLDAWAVPREFLREPEVMLMDVKRAWRAGRKDIPGLSIVEKMSVAIRATNVMGE